MYPKMYIAKYIEITSTDAKWNFLLILWNKSVLLYQEHWKINGSDIAIKIVHLKHMFAMK